MEPRASPLVEALAIHQLKDRELLAVRFVKAIDGADVRVVARRKHFGVTLKPREPLGIGGHRRGKHLDRNRPLQIAVGRAVDLAHATGANLRSDYIDADARARSESQTLGIIRTRRHPERDYS